MSIMSDDKKVLEGRRNKLGADARITLRDQVVKKLFNRLEDEKVGLHVREAWNLETSRIAELLKRQEIYLRDLDEHLPADAEQPFSGSSNLHIPMPFIVSKTYQARFMQALWSVDPPFTVRARREDGVDKENLIEGFMRFVVYSWANCYRGVEEEVETWIKQWIDTGTGILKVRWDVQWAKFLDTEEQAVPAPPKVIQTETGESILVPQMDVREVEVDRKEKKFSGPMVETVPLEDFRMVGGRGDPDLADMVMHRSFMTASQLWTGVDLGYFDADNVEEVIRSGEDRQSAALGRSIDTIRAEHAGKASVDTETDLDRYEIIEAYLRRDVDNSGINSDIVVWVHGDTGRILRATYLHRIDPQGARPFAVIHFHKKMNEEYGTGLLETLHPLSVELDAMHNMRIDNGIITNMPVGFYRPSSGLDPETIQMEPGQLIPLDNPQADVYFPPRPNATSFGAQEEAAIQSYVERLTGVSDLSLGVMSGQQGATRTASGVRALLGESNSNLDLHLRRLMRGWKKALHLLYTQVAVRGDQQMIFRVTGEDGKEIFHRITRDRDLVAVDFELNANSANSNKSVQIETSQQLMQLTMNPINIQLGISGPNEIYNAQKAYLSSLGIKNPHSFIKRPASYMINLTPEEEMNRVIRGQDVPVALNADHEGFIAFVQTLLKSQEKMQLIDEQAILALISQVRKHEEAMNALRQQQAQAAVQQQMMANAALSQNQAPPAMNPLEGAAPGQMA